MEKKDIDHNLTLINLNVPLNEINKNNNNTNNKSTAIILKIIETKTAKAPLLNLFSVQSLFFKQKKPYFQIIKSNISNEEISGIVHEYKDEENGKIFESNNINFSDEDFKNGYINGDPKEGLPKIFGTIDQFLSLQKIQSDSNIIKINMKENDIILRYK